MRTDGTGDQLPLTRAHPVDEDVRREIEFHVQERANELERQGVPRDRALAQARETFGNRAAVEAECRAIERRRRATSRRADFIAELWQDITVGWRVLGKNPGFTLASVITLALGIGANSAVFSIVNHVILQPLPYEHSERMVKIVERHEKGWGNVPWANFLDLEKDSRSFDAMASYGTALSTVLGAGDPLRVRTGVFSKGFPRIFNIRLFKGRWPADDEHRVGAAPVAVVTYAFWRDHLGSVASLDGVRLRASMDYAVIGVLPPGFDFGDATQIWAPMELTSQSMYRTSHNWDVIATLKPGVTPATAQDELDHLLARMKPLYYPDFDATGSTVTPLQAVLTSTMRTPLYLLLGASAVLLLAACTNLASAMLARGTARSGEFAVRSALGATRVRLLRQLLAESALLAVLGSVAGLMLAFLTLRAFVSFAPASIGLRDVHVDAWVQGFTLCVAVVTTVLVGLFPALRLSESNTLLALREGGRGTAGVRRMRAWNVLVGAEVALAVMLLAGSTLLIKSFGRVMDTKLGFDPANSVAVLVNLPPVNYGDTSATVRAFHERVLGRIQQLPGVEHVGFVNVMMLQGSNPNGAMRVEGKPLDPRGPFTGSSVYRVIGGEFFEAAGIPIVRGHAFQTAADGAHGVVVNEEFAAKEWPNADPLGKRVMVAGMDSGTEPWFTVIGVAGNVRANSITSPFLETYYFDHHARPAYRTRGVTYVVRSHLAPAVIVPQLRDAISSVDAQVPVVMHPVSFYVTNAISDRRFTVLILSAFAVVALALAVAGIYAVVSYSVAQRRREIGVRLALGATPGGVRRMVLISAMWAVVPGLLAGVLLAIADSNALKALLYGVSPIDWTTLAASVVVLGLAALLSSLLPALRATRVDPMITLRTE